MTKASEKAAREIADTSRDESEFVISKYNKVVRSAELLDIRLVASKFYAKPEYFEQKDEVLSPDSGAKLAIVDTLKWADYDPELGLLVGHLDWEAGCRKGRRRLLSVTASYLIAYRVSKNLEAKYVNVFLGNVGRFAVFPYFRSLVAQYSSASAAELPILPVLKQEIAESPATEGMKEDD
jgi:hypothetical protein